MNTSPLSLLSSRMIQCLGLLNDSQDYLTVNHLAEQLKISKRTLFRELKDIDPFLNPYGMVLTSKTGLGLKLEGEVENRFQFKRHLVEAGLELSNFSREDRQTVLLSELLKNQQLDKFIVYANQFGVSEATISHDIDALEPQLEHYQLRLVRRPGINLTLEGSEDAKRKAIRDFIYNHLEEQKFTALLNIQAPWDIESYFKNQGPDSILQILNKDVLWQVIHVLKENDFFWVNRLAQNAYVGLILHLTIAIERMFNSDPIHMDESLLMKLQKDPMFEKAKDLSEYFEDEFNLVFPLEEVAYISMHLKGARLLNIEPSSEELDESDFSISDLQRVIYQLITEFERVALVNLKQDDLLISGLITHLRPALTRVKYQMEIRNPLLKQIQDQYPSVYAQSLKAVKALNDQSFNQLNADEIGFIAMHFGAAIERLNQSHEGLILNVAVLCASGIGISSLLASRLKRIFKDSVEVSARSHLDLKSLAQEGIDLIVSTMELQGTPLPVIMVNPLLSDEDIFAIQKELQNLSHARHEEDEVKDNVSWDKQLQLIASMTTHLDGLLKSIRIEHLDSTLKSEALLPMISRSVQVDDELSLQVLNDLIRREQMGNVLLQDERLVLFHARTNGVELPCLSLFRCEGDFEAYAPDRIQTLMVLLVPKSAPLELNRWLSRLSAALIEDPLYLKSIHTKDVHELKEEVLRILYEPYKEWMKKQL